MRDSSRSKSSSNQTQHGQRGKQRRNQNGPRTSTDNAVDEHQQVFVPVNRKEPREGVSPGTNVSPMRESLTKLTFPPSVYALEQSAMEHSFMNQTSLTTGGVAETFRAQVLAACQVTTTISPSVTTAFAAEPKSQTLTPLIEAFSLERFQIPDMSARPTPPEAAVNLNGDIAEAFRAQVLAACAAKEANSANMDDLVSAISSDPVTGAITANESPNIVPSVFKTPTMDPVVMDCPPQEPPIPIPADVSFADPISEVMADIPVESSRTPPMVPAPLDPMSTGPRVSVAKLMPVITPPSPKSPQSGEFDVLPDDEVSKPYQPEMATNDTCPQIEKENLMKESPRPTSSPDTPKIVSEPPTLVTTEESEDHQRVSITESELPTDGTLCPRNSVVDPPADWTDDFPTDGTLCPRNSVTEQGPESPRKTIYEGILSSPKKIVGGGQIVMDIMSMLSPKADKKVEVELEEEPLFALFSSAKKQREEPVIPTTMNIDNDDLVTSFVSEDIGAALAAPLSPPKIYSSDPITEKVLDEIIETIMQEQAIVAQPLPTGDEENPVGMIVKLTPEAPVETAPQTSFYVDLVRDNPAPKSFSSEIPVSPIESLRVNNVPPERDMKWLPTAGPPMPGIAPVVAKPSPPSPPSPQPKQKKKCFCF